MRGCCCCYSVLVEVEVAAVSVVLLLLLLRLSAVVQHTCLMKYGAIMPHNGYLGPLIAIPGLIIRLQLHSDCDSDCDCDCDCDCGSFHASLMRRWFALLLSPSPLPAVPMAQRPQINCTSNIIICES
ncbi:hypothetical protein AWZ03_006107 [Drosophila navojoa]|uniref:Uncharacterized protein n=1 Tax=Drosophila navojoa TaxID=7232 RepID=A0A484BI83_DRONA|nr:hypothetical protein AWZ03_006107 [Drosophila navojoa]